MSLAILLAERPPSVNVRGLAHDFDNTESIVFHMLANHLDRITNHNAYGTGYA